MTTRHEFLAALHEVLEPKIYMEVGVQHGWSLDLAHEADRALGIDPEPLVQRKPGSNQTIYQMTSDTYFKGQGWPVIPNTIDLGFIDGMHLMEYALRDFIGMSKLANHKTVIVFDDVLPRNQAEASRTQCPGDWTGDVWKLDPIIRSYLHGVESMLIDTQPTGLLLVWGFEKRNGFNQLRYTQPHVKLTEKYDEILARYGRDEYVPDDVINRADAISPEHAISMIQKWIMLRRDWEKED